MHLLEQHQYNKMACRNGELRDESKTRNAAAAASVAVGDALLFTMICIIGMPVDVHAKDGSIYSGIFHTASVDEDYAIVLKKAAMIKKGNLDANLVNGDLVETLLVRSVDLVQVVAKGDLLPSNGITGYVEEDGIEAAAGYNECLHRDAQGGIQSFSVSRSALVTCCEAQQIALHFPEDTMPQEPQGVLSACSGVLKDQDQVRATSDVSACTVASTPAIDVNSESCLSALSNPFPLVPPKRASFERTAKESKLSPGAKSFSPSILHHRMVTPPTVPNGAGDPYMPGAYPMAPMATTQEEVDRSCFACSSVPLKFVPYNNAAFGCGGNDTPYVQPVIGQVVNRAQPIRYTRQCQNFQLGHPHVLPNPQNVMYGRVGPLVRMHPISSDIVLSPAGFSPAVTQPPHRAHLPKHQVPGTNGFLSTKFA